MHPLLLIKGFPTVWRVQQKRQSVVWERPHNKQTNKTNKSLPSFIDRCTEFQICLDDEIIYIGNLGPFSSTCNDVQDLKWLQESKNTASECPLKIWVISHSLVVLTRLSHFLWRSMEYIVWAVAWYQTTAKPSLQKLNWHEKSLFGFEPPQVGILPAAKHLI